MTDETPQDKIAVTETVEVDDADAVAFAKDLEAIDETPDAPEPAKATAPEADADDDSVTPPKFDEVDTGDNASAKSFVGEDPEVLNAIYARLIDEQGPTTFITNASIPGTYENVIVTAMRQSYPEAYRAQDAISDIPKDHRFSPINDDSHGDPIVKATFLKRMGNLKGAVLSGPEGLMRMRASRKRGQILRAPLFNSGFCLFMRTPNSDDIYNRLIRDCRLDTVFYGNQFGAHYFVYSHLLLMDRFASFLIDMVLQSNLKDFMKPQVLLDNILLPDVLVAMTYIAYSEWPDGYPHYEHACTNPDRLPDGTYCHHVETAIKADLLEFINVDWTRLNPDAVAHMTNCRKMTHTVSPEDIAAYRKNAGIVEKTFAFGDDIKITMAVPSLTDYLAAGAQFNNALTNDIQADNLKGIYEAAGFRKYRLYLAWVKSISTIDDTGEVIGVVTDKDNIASMLDDLLPEDTDGVIEKNALDYINDTPMTHIGYPVFKCPSCGYAPKTKSGYFTVDPIANFFTLLDQKLPVI